MYTIDEIFDYMHRIADLDDTEGGVNINVYINGDGAVFTDDDPTENNSPCCANGCCAIHLPDDKPDMAFEFSDMLNAAVSAFGRKYGLITPSDFEKRCGVPAWFIEAVDNGTVLEKLVK